MRLLSLLTRLFAFAGKGERSSATASTRKAGPPCEQCGAANRHNARRCMQCGLRLAFADPGQTGSILSELEEQILIAATELDRDRIYSIPSVGDAKGELKAGNIRIYGEEALRALESLVGNGLVEPETEGSHVVTAYGKHALRRHRNASQND